MSFVSFIRPQNSTQSLAECTIDPGSQDFKAYVEGHKVFGNKTCPVSVYIHLITIALVELFEKEEQTMTEGDFCIEQLETQSPLGLQPQRMISLSLELSDYTAGRWSFRICSHGSTSLLRVANHASGVAYVKALEPSHMNLEVQSIRPRIQNGEEGTMGGSFIYNIFSLWSSMLSTLKAYKKSRP